MGHKAAHAAEIAGGRMSQLFIFFLVFLGLASNQEQGNKISMTSSATMGLNV